MLSMHGVVDGVDVSGSQTDDDGMNLDSCPKGRGGNDIVCKFEMKLA